MSCRFFCKATHPKSCQRMSNLYYWLQAKYFYQSILISERLARLCWATWSFANVIILCCVPWSTVLSLTRLFSFKKLEMLCIFCVVGYCIFLYIVHWMKHKYSRKTRSHLFCKQQIIGGHHHFITIWDANWRGHLGSRIHLHSNSDFNKNAPPNWGTLCPPVNCTFQKPAGPSCSSGIRGHIKKVTLFEIRGTLNEMRARLRNESRERSFQNLREIE